MKIPQLTVCWATLLLALSAGAQTTAPIRVIEETAIPYTRFLSKAEFDQRFPGERLDDPSQLDPGWYVIYEHESLKYYFGPMLLESTGKDYLVQLEAIVEAAVAERPSITGYTLELSYEPSEVAGLPSGNSPRSPDSDASTKSGAGAPPPKRTWSLFDFLRRLFGL